MSETVLMNRLLSGMPDVYAHGERTAYYATAIAREMGLPGSSLASIREAAIIHDIGKLFIPAEVLNKPGALTKEEKELVDKHSSQEILSLLDFESPFVRYVAEHHHDDRKSITPECRIISAADAFDALTSKRCYRDPLPWDEAINTLRTDPRNSCLDRECIEALEAALIRERELS